MSDVEGLRYVEGVEDVCIEKSEGSETDGDLYLQGPVDSDADNSGDVDIYWHFKTTDAGESWVLVEETTD